jgi:hypothetical protein
VNELLFRANAAEGDHNAEVFLVIVGDPYMFRQQKYRPLHHSFLSWCFEDFHRRRCCLIRLFRLSHPVATVAEALISDKAFVVNSLRSRCHEHTLDTLLARLTTRGNLAFA